MARPIKQSLADLDVMAEAVNRKPNVLYAKDYYEKRFQNAKGRVVSDLGAVGEMFERVLCDEDERGTLIEALRGQFEK